MKVICGLKSTLIEADRILVIGCPGSGKSTLAKRLSQALDLDYISMDRDFYWLPGWRKRPRDEIDRRIAKAVAEVDHGWDGPQLLPSSPAARRRRHLASAAQICMPVRRHLESVPVFRAQPPRTACRQP
ncbi:hypothetical protein GGI53_002648 [Rhizobium leguminosarum]|nr:hypothetical protein [Rhizobium leguminosarum]